ncbi:MAG: pectate lyase, partial [Pyrinomonadaceae bacterium]|nr:pectate lyase [Pyrinomonadaceae bacterium]
EKHKTAFLKGLDYLLASQYENGGFPQYFPIQKGYYAHITYNDDAMIGVLKILRDIAKKRDDYAFVDETRRAKAEIAVQKGIECILKTQIKVNNTLTVWCAQHDEKTFAPSPARKFEPISLSGYESVAIVEFLMTVQNPGQDVISSIESAVSWFQKTKINGIKVVEKPDKSTRGYDRIVINDKTAEPLWARFYDIQTNRPIFIGRDSIIKYSLAEIEEERRNGYNYYTAEPNDLIKRNYTKWRQKLIAKSNKN